MLRRHLHGRGIKNPRLLDAFAQVPREMFVPDEYRFQAYEDHPVPIGGGQTISQPYIVALMVQELDPRPDHRVLDVGSGSGYQTAILAKLAGHVYAVERLEQLAQRSIDILASLDIDNVSISTHDGTLGWPEEAPFDRIICGAAAPDVPRAWTEQLSEGGRIIMPVGGRFVQTLVAVDKKGGETTRRSICDVRFVKLLGKDGW